MKSILMSLFIRGRKFVLYIADLCMPVWTMDMMCFGVHVSRHLNLRESSSSYSTMNIVLCRRLLSV